MASDPRPTDATFEQMLLTCRIIAGALVFGVVAFATVVIVLRLGEPAEDAVLVSLVAAGFAVIAAAARQVILGVMSGRTGESTRPDAGAVTPLGLFQTRMIVGLALLEGAAFFNCIAYLIEGHWWTLLVIAALVAWMLAAYPTRTRLRQWAADREQLETFGPGERT